MASTRLFSSLAITLNELGAKDASLYWTDRLLEKIFGGFLRVRRYAFVCQPLRTGAAQRAGKSSLTVRQFASDDPVRARFPVPSAVIDQRIQQGSICFVAEMDGQFAGYIWLHFGPYHEDEVACVFEPTPPERICWDFDVYVAPTFRATRTFIRLWQAAEEHLRARGYTHSASRISTYNAMSMRSHARSGAIVVGTALFVTLGRRQLTIASKGLLREGKRVTLHALPRILVTPLLATPSLQTSS